MSFLVGQCEGWHLLPDLYPDARLGQVILPLSPAYQSLLNRFVRALGELSRTLCHLRRYCLSAGVFCGGACRGSSSSREVRAEPPSRAAS
jgi:hypothetical protein